MNKSASDPQLKGLIEKFPFAKEEITKSFMSTLPGHGIKHP